MTIDENKLNEFVNKAVSDVGSTMSSILVVLGDRLGLWKAMAAAGPIDAAALAQRTETHERYVREWLDAQASAGYVTYDPKTKKYTLPPEQAAALADETSPAFFPGLFEVAAACWAATDKMTDRFRTGGGIEWGHHHPCLFQGTERFFRSSYIGNLVQAWLPSLDGVVAKLERGARVADVGCGVGASTILMAKAFPKSQFFGFDYHERLDRARANPRGRRGRRRSRLLRGGEVDGILPRRGLRPRRVLRLSPRHARPEGLRRARAPGARRGRHLDDRRAVRQRQARGEPQRRRARLLLGEHDAVRTALSRVRRSWARSAGG